MPAVLVVIGVAAALFGIRPGASIWASALLRANRAAQRTPGRRTRPRCSNPLVRVNRGQTISARDWMARTGLDGKNSKVPLVKVRPAERSRDTSCSGWRPQVWRTLRRSWRLGGCRIAGSGNSARTTRRRFRALRSSPRFAATVPEQWGSTRLSAVRRPGRRGAIHGANWPTRMRNLGTRKRFFVTNHA
jgi:hypothetical protein